ncbi:MAG: LysM domain-containing protein [Psychromonas sp.]
MKVKHVVSLLLGATVSFVTLADTLSLKKNHPQRYRIVEGDTLWGISARFLNAPWLWPRLWQVNTHVEEPHLIYPGDVLTLIWADGEPRLTPKKFKKLSPTVDLKRKRKAIPTIPLSVISAFLSKDHVIEPALIENSPRLLGDAIGSPRFLEGDIFYAQGQYIKNKLYGIYRLGKNYSDPVNEEFLGQQLIFIGLSEVSDSLRVQGSDQLTPHFLLSSAREAKQGDLILAIPEYETLPAYFLPQPLSSNLTGYLLGALNGATTIGKWDSVVIDKGTREGVQIGSMFSIMRGVLAVFVDKDKIEYQEDASRWDQFREADITLPAERLGEIMIFKTYEKVSIGLVMHSTDIIRVNDKIEGLEF